MKNFIAAVVGLKNKKFVKDVAVLQIGAIVSTGLSFVGSVVYARVLGVEGYANYALIFAFVALVSIFMHVGTDQATLTLLSGYYGENRKDKVKEILSYYLKITLIFNITVSLLVIVIAPYLTDRLYDAAFIGRLARLVILANAVKIFWGMLSIVLQVVRKIKLLAILENINKAVYVLVPAGLVLAGYGLEGLVWGHFIVALFFAVIAIFLYKKIYVTNDIFPRWRELFTNISNVSMKYYFKFGFLIAVDKNLSGLYGTLPIFLLGIYHLQSVAYYKIAAAYAVLPLLLSGPISRLLAVQLPKSKTYSYRVLKRDFVHSAIGSVLVVFSVASVLAVVGFFLIPFVYGQEFIPAISMSYPLLLSSVIASMGVGLGPILRTMNLMKKSIIINVIVLFVGGVLLYFAISKFSVMVAVYVIAFWMPVAEIIFMFYVIKKLNKLIALEDVKK